MTLLQLFTRGHKNPILEFVLRRTMYYYTGEARYYENILSGLTGIIKNSVIFGRPHRAALRSKQEFAMKYKLCKLF